MLKRLDENRGNLYTCPTGAAITVGGEAPPFPGGVLLAPLKGGVMRMQITLSELFQFCMVIIGIIGLVLQAKKK